MTSRSPALVPWSSGASPTWRCIRGLRPSASFARLRSTVTDPTSLLYPVALVHLARAYAQNRDIDEARKTYEEFFALWKEADSDIPILIAARREYAALPKS